MKNCLLLSILAIFVSGCTTSRDPDRPYYFRSILSNHDEMNLPHEELTKEQADSLAREGKSYYISYFNASQKPVKIVFVNEGKTISTREFGYDADGKVIQEAHYEPSEGEMPTAEKNTKFNRKTERFNFPPLKNRP